MELFHFKAPKAELGVVVLADEPVAVATVDVDLADHQIHQRKRFQIYREDLENLSAHYEGVLDLGDFPPNKRMVFESIELVGIAFLCGIGDVVARRGVAGVAGRYSMTFGYAHWWAEKLPFHETPGVLAAAGGMSLQYAFAVGRADLETWSANARTLLTSDSIPRFGPRGSAA